MMKNINRIPILYMQNNVCIDKIMLSGKFKFTQILKVIKTKFYLSLILLLNKIIVIKTNTVIYCEIFLQCIFNYIYF